MPKLKIKRREFLKYAGLSTLTFLPGIKGLSAIFGKADPQGFITHKFRLINFRNLLNVEFYFINTIDSDPNKSPNTLGSGNKTMNSYMIVRLPQQHVAEEYIYKNTENDVWRQGSDPVGDTLYVQTRIAGYSYLAFKIEYGRHPEQELPLHPKDLMNWNSAWFTLLVRSDLEGSIFDMGDKWPANGQTSHQNQYPLGYRNSDPKTKAFSFSEENFPKAWAHPFNENNGGTKYLHYDPSPFTAIEAPYRLILSPQLPDPYLYDFSWSFSSQGKENRDQGKKSQAELWMATLTVAKKPVAGGNKHVKIEDKASEDETNQSRVKGSSLLQLMILGSPDYIASGKGNDNPCVVDRSGFQHEFLRNYLPRNADRYDLVKLYLIYHLRDKVSQRLTASAPQLCFSPLGLSSEIEFKNKDYAKNHVSLYEWKQSLSFGRDQEVKVSRVVVEACFGLKMLHVETTKRRTTRGVSALIYEEFLMPLESEKDYTLYDNEQNIQTFKKPNYKCGTPFKKVRFADLKPKQIRPIKHFGPGDNGKYIIRGADDCQDIYAYWSLAYEVVEDNGPIPDGKAQNIYLEWNFIGTDWHGVDTHFKKKIFVLTSMLTYQPNGQGVSSLYKDEQISIKDAKGQLIGYSGDLGLRKTLDNKYGPAIVNNDPWFQILRTSDDFLLKQLNIHRDYLDPLLTDIESRVMAQAGEIEDVVSEKFKAYKAEVLQAGLNVFQSATDVLSEVTKVIQAINTGLLISDDAKKAYAGARTKIYDFSNRWLDAIKDTSANPWWQDLCDKINTLAASIPELKDLVPQMHGINFLPEGEKPEDFQDEFNRFLNAMPRKYLDKLDGVKKQLQQQAADIKRVSYRIEELEHSFKSKISIYKNTVGYAVYQMEDQLDTFRSSVEQKIKSRLQNAQNAAQQVVDHVVNAATEEYNKQVARLSKFKTDYLILQNNVRSMAASQNKIFNFFDDYSCFPQLHTAKVYMDHVNNLVQKEIPLKIAYAEDYIKNQLDDKLFNYTDNASRVFARLHTEGKEYLKGAMRQVGSELGGMVNPELPADFVTYLKKVPDKAIQNDLNSMAAEAQPFVDAVNSQYKAADAELQQTVATISGSLNSLSASVKGQIASVQNQLTTDIENEVNNVKTVFQSQANQLVLIGQQAKDKFEQAKGYVQMQANDFFGALQSRILGALRLQDIIGVKMNMPELNKTHDSVYYNFITKGLQPKELGPFKFTPNDSTRLVCFMQKSLVNASDYVAWTRLENFAIEIFDGRLVINFGKLQIASNSQEKNKVTVEIGKVDFQKELAFIQAISKNIKIPGTGITIDINPTNISVRFSYAIPGISGGAFTFNNLKFNIGVIIPFPIGKAGLSPLVATFGINSPDDKFVIAAGVFGGRGHFVIGTTPKYLKSIDCGFEFGGYIGLDLVIAKGEAFVMAGVRYVYDRNEIGEATIDFYSIFTCGGSVTVFGFITVSVYFILCLRYRQSAEGSSLYGTATLTYSIKIGFFEKSFSLTYAKQLSGSETNTASGTFNNLRQGRDNIYYVSQREAEEEPNESMLGFTDESWVQFCNSFDLN
jgi:hypothetical protein